MSRWCSVRGVARRVMALLGVLLLLSACAPSARQVLPTPRPTATVTPSPTATRTPDPAGGNVTPTATPPRPQATVTGGPSPTPLFGATSTPAPFAASPTRVQNPNAPRIEFFTTDALAAAPGASVTLFWSTRGADSAVIYRLDATGARNQLWNVAPDGSLSVATSARDRGSAEFVLSVGDGAQRSEQRLVIALTCPVAWFFAPAPAPCPNSPASETTVIEQSFQRGRMVYIEATNTVYVLFNDGFAPAWTPLPNRYNPAVHAAQDANFVPPPGLVQPQAALGFVWRGNDRVRSRLGLGTAPEYAFVGNLQTAGAAEQTRLFVSSADGTVLQLLPGGDSWEIITPP